jgi:hypothetical protein
LQVDAGPDVLGVRIVCAEADGSREVLGRLVEAIEADQGMGPMAIGLGDVRGPPEALRVPPQ